MQHFTMCVSNRKVMLEVMTFRFLWRVRPLWTTSLLRYSVPLCLTIIGLLHISSVLICVHLSFQIEDIRTSIDKIDESVTEIKKVYSTILSAPTSDQSEWHKRTMSHRIINIICVNSCCKLSLYLPPPEIQDQVETLTNEIKKSANNARNKLKSQCLIFLLCFLSVCGQPV